MADAIDPKTIAPLSERFLPAAIAIEIRDDGFGMTADELNERFLWTARKRRTLPDLKRTTSRPLMGRKGLGKLAGFGVARVLEVITKKANNKQAIKFELDYDKILQLDSLDQIEIPSTYDDSVFGVQESGTIIRLKRLGFDAVKSRETTVESELGEHFEFIDPKDFMIELNEERVRRPSHKFAFAWPDPDTPHMKLVSHSIDTEVGKISFDWRIRFRMDRQSLPAQKRGIRIYTHNRMAAPPSLFNADTNMHGFRMTDYLDGVVVADFIDDQTQDYVATDRQSLRWDTPLLSPLQEFLSDQITEACKKYQAVRDIAKKNEVLEDKFTEETISSGNLSTRELNLVRAVAVRLARFSKQGVEDEQYKEVLPQVVRAIGHGTLFATLSEMAQSQYPDIDQLIAEVARLNRSELDGSMSIVRSRLKAIEALTKEVGRTPLQGGPRNEGAVQRLFEEAPWLIDPLYKDFLTADKSMNETFKQLAASLRIDDSEVPEEVEGSGRREADFVFLLADIPLRLVLIVELKAPNKYAIVDDILQLSEYIDTAKKWLGANGESGTIVRGELICTPPPRDSKSRGHRRFWISHDKLSPESPERVRPYLQVLKDTKQAHDYILKVAGKLSNESDLSEFK